MRRGRGNWARGVISAAAKMHDKRRAVAPVLPSHSGAILGAATPAPFKIKKAVLGKVGGGGRGRGRTRGGHGEVSG